MKKGDRVQISWFAMVSLMAAFFVLVLATFAWFAHNKTVDTGKAAARSGNENVLLQLSTEGGDSFSPEKQVSILQVNNADKTDLMPVSTADLKTFVTNSHTEAGIAENFAIVGNEEGIYHGRVYLRAKAEGDSRGKAMDLYLDQTEASGGRLVDADSELLNASRLGIVISGEGKEAGTIFYLSNRNSSGDKQVYNTRINGQILGKGKVLDGSAGEVRVAEDPAVSLDSRALSESGEGYVLPGKPLMTIEVNRIYRVDVYFYLEGCDPDCSDAVAFDPSGMHLAFFGTVKE